MTDHLDPFRPPEEETSRPGDRRLRKKTLLAIVITGAVVVGAGSWAVYEWYPKPCGTGSRSPVATTKGLVRNVQLDDYGNADRYYPCGEEPGIEQLEELRHLVSTDAEVDLETVFVDDDGTVMEIRINGTPAYILFIENGDNMISYMMPEDDPTIT